MIYIFGHTTKTYTMRIKVLFTFILIALLNLNNSIGAEKLSPYYNLGSVKGTITDAVAKVKSALEENGFEVIGNYNPENNNNLHALVYTNSSLQELCLIAGKRTALAAALKVGFVKNGDVITISMSNPDYLFNAYFQDEYETYKTKLFGISEKAKSSLKLFNSSITPFGGEVELDDLREYQYMWGMEEFTDPVDLNEFKSFEEGLNTIRKNLTAKKGNTIKVYELIFTDKKIAVFGVGLLDPEDGEKFFLPIIGEDHVCAMPYEIILEGNKATMLHGRYRIALHWPELTMGTFTKIVVTPGDIEAFLEAICQ